MRCDRFRSKGLVYFLIGAFLLLNMAESVPASASGSSEEDKGPVVRIRANAHISSAQQERFETLMAEGKKLYDDMENESALQKFQQATAFAVTQRQKSDVYFYLSLVYFSLLEAGRSNEFTNAVNMLIEVDYYRQLDPQVCPQSYIEMYQEIKRNYGVLKVRSNPAGANVYLNDSRDPSGVTPLTIAALAGEINLEVKKGKKKAKDTIEVVAGEETQSPEYELKGKSSTIYIIGGVLLAAGVGAAVALGGGGGESGGTAGPNIPVTTGALQVNSTPTGAQIYLDGQNTGKTTNATVSNVSPGNHALMLVKEGYIEYEQEVSVNAGQTATVNAGLNKHVLTIKSPAKNSEWNIGDEMEILWELQANSQSLLPITALGNSTHMPHPAGLTRYPNPAPGRVASRSRSTRSPLNKGSRTTAQSPQIRSLQSVSTSSSVRRTPYAGGIPSPYVNRTPILGQSSIQSSSDRVGIQSLTTVKIDLYKGGNLHLNITQSTENDGSYEWIVPNSLKPGTDYKIRISSDKSEEVSYLTPVFKIVDLPFSLVVDKSEVTVKEGKTASFNVKLSAKPDANVNVTVRRSSGDEDITVVSGSSLTFTKSNRGTFQRVVLSAGADVDRWHGEAIIRVSTADAPNKDVLAIENDKDYVEGPVLGLSPIEDFSSAGIVGGPFSPEEKVYKITNYGNSPLVWEIEENANWLDVSITSGDLAPGENVKPRLVINSNANGLAVGSHSVTVNFVNQTDNVGTTSIKTTLIVASEAPPGAPSNLTANSVNLSLLSYRIDLSWNDNSNNETGFEVWRAHSIKGVPTVPVFSRIATLSANTTSYADGGASTEGIYHYRVRAFKDTTFSSYSNQETEVNVDAPSNLDVVFNVLRATLTWKDNCSLEDKFYIYKKNSPGAPWVKIAEVGANVKTYEEVYSVPPASGTYYFSVRSVCFYESNTYYSENSASAFFTVL